MAHEFDTDNDKGDDLNDFESFLRERDKQWSKPAQELKPTDLQAIPKLDETYEIRDVVDAVENSNGSTKSIETVASIQVTTSTSVDVVASAVEPVSEREVEVKVHTHPIVGTYVTEESVAWRLDPAVLEMFTKTRQIAINDLSLEQIIERIHKIERAVKLLRVQEQGLNSAMAEKISKLNDADREKYREMNRKEGLKNQTRTRIERTKKAAGGSAAVKPRPVGKSASAKQVDMFKKNGYTKDAVIEHMKTTKRLDAPTLAYIEKLVWE